MDIHPTVISENVNIDEYFTNLLIRCNDKQCSVGCKGQYDDIHCPLCSKFKPNRKAKVLKHINSHFRNTVKVDSYLICVCRKKCM